MIEIRRVCESELEEFRRLHNRYVDRDESIEIVSIWYREHPELLLGAYDDGTLVGHCLGLPQFEDGVELNGIAVEQSHRRRGIGSALLAAFEERVASLGYRRISLGSAGGFVDEFYVENGYSPESVLVRLGPEAVPENYRGTGFEIVDERIEDGMKKLYIGADEPNPAFVEEIRTAFDDPDAIYIMTKNIDTS